MVVIANSSAGDSKVMLLVVDVLVVMDVTVLPKPANLALQDATIMLVVRMLVD